MADAAFHSPLVLEEAHSNAIVWARIKGNPFWPSQQLSEAAVLRHLPERHRKNCNVPVMLFGTLETAWVSAANIISFGEGVQRGFLTKSKHFMFQIALEEVIKFLSTDSVRQAPVSWWCLPPALGSRNASEQSTTTAFLEDAVGGNGTPSGERLHPLTRQLCCKKAEPLYDQGVAAGRSPSFGLSSADMWLLQRGTATCASAIAFPGHGPQVGQRAEQQEPPEQVQQQHQVQQCMQVLPSSYGCATALPGQLPMPLLLQQCLGLVVPSGGVIGATSASGSAARGAGGAGSVDEAVEMDATTATLRLQEDICHSLPRKVRCLAGMEQVEQGSAGTGGSHIAAASATAPGGAYAVTRGSDKEAQHSKAVRVAPAEPDAGLQQMAQERNSAAGGVEAEPTASTSGRQSCSAGGSYWQPPPPAAAVQQVRLAPGSVSTLYEELQALHRQQFPPRKATMRSATSRDTAAGAGSATGQAWGPVSSWPAAQSPGVKAALTARKSTPVCSRGAQHGGGCRMNYRALGDGPAKGDGAAKPKQQVEASQPSGFKVSGTPCPMPVSQPLPEQPPRYELLDCNVWVSRRRPARIPQDDVLLCTCEVWGCADPLNPRDGCGGACLNRILSVHCDPTSCPCGMRCTNRPFAFLQRPQLAPFLTTDHRGYGVLALEPISAGSFVIEYVGEVIDDVELCRRIDEAHSGGARNFYYMAVEKRLYIDARRRGNMARLLNSSCEPNCETQKWRDAATGETRVGIFAKQDIASGTELTYNYMTEQYGIGGGSAFVCMCGAQKCRGVLDFNPERRQDIGRRLDVWWEGEQAFFRGTVVSYSLSSRKHTVEYDDGDKERVCLDDVLHRWLDADALEFEGPISLTGP